MCSLFAARKIEGSQCSNPSLLDLLEGCFLSLCPGWEQARTAVAGVGVLSVSLKNFILKTLKLGEKKRQDFAPRLWVIH